MSNWNNRSEMNVRQNIGNGHFFAHLRILCHQATQSHIGKVVKNVDSLILCWSLMSWRGIAQTLVWRRGGGGDAQRWPIENKCPPPSLFVWFRYWWWSPWCLRLNDEDCFDVIMDIILMMMENDEPADPSQGSLLDMWYQTSFPLLFFHLKILPNLNLASLLCYSTQVKDSIPFVSNKTNYLWQLTESQ